MPTDGGIDSDALSGGFNAIIAITTFFKPGSQFPLAAGLLSPMPGWQMGTVNPLWIQGPICPQSTLSVGQEAERQKGRPWKVMPAWLVLWSGTVLSKLPYFVEPSEAS